MTFKPGPTMEQLPETAPKTRKQRSDTGKPRGTRRRRSLKPQIGAALMQINLALWAFPPTRGDALDAAETDALVEAIDVQAKGSPTFRRYLEAALAVTGSSGLISVLIIIGARRMARHEILLPAEADERLGAMLGGITTAQAMAAAEAPVAEAEPESPAEAA